MLQTILNTTITFITSGILGYCISAIKNYKKQKDKIMEEFGEIKESQLADMKSDLSSKFFVYDTMEEVEDYLVYSFREKCERYFHLGGDSWIHDLYNKSLEWKIKQTLYTK